MNPEAVALNRLLDEPGRIDLIMMQTIAAERPRESWPEICTRAASMPAILERSRAPATRLLPL